MKEKCTTIDEYLAAVDEDKRAALEKLRQQIKRIVPQAEEGIYYHLPAFRLSGKWLVAFGAAKTHCAFYPLSAATINALQDELKKYETSKGTIRYQADKPMPLTLVRNIVKARIFENELKRKRAKGK